MVSKLLKSASDKKITKKEIDLDIIVDKVNEGYLVDKKPKRRSKIRFSPSVLVYGHGVCPRFWYLSFDGGLYEEEFTPQQVANMENGSKSHERMQDAIKKTDIYQTSEFDVEETDPPIFGRADLLLKINDDDVINEIKTVDDIGFQRIQQSGKPRSYHVLQLLLYMKILNLGVGSILYENKNTHEMMVFPVTVTPKYKDFVLYMFDWVREVYKAWENKTLPQRPFRTKTKICQRCPLVNTCYSREEGDIMIKRRKEFEL